MRVLGAANRGVGGGGLEVKIALGVADGGITDQVVDMHVCALRHDDMDIECLRVAVVFGEIEPVVPVPHAVFLVARDDELTAGGVDREVVNATLLAGDLDRYLRLRLDVDAKPPDQAVDLEI